MKLSNEIAVSREKRMLFGLFCLTLEKGLDV